MNFKKPLLLLIMYASFILLYSCNSESNTSIISTNKWNLKSLKDKANENLDSAMWNDTLLNRDVKAFAKYKKEYEKYPLSNNPFPVSDYHFAVYQKPYAIKKDSLIFKAVQIGEYNEPQEDSVISKLMLIVLTNNDSIEANTFVNSRNSPYLTAQGYYKFKNNKYKWVFSASPDGYSTLFFSMKLFDLRFGKTIVIYPQKNHSFYYNQIELSPDDFANINGYFKAIKKKL